MLSQIFNRPKPDNFQFEMRCLYVVPVALPNVFSTKCIQFLFTDTIIELVKILQTQFRSIKPTEKPSQVSGVTWLSMLQLKKL